MNSTRLMVFLLCVYAAILLASAWEKNWVRALYWLGAMIIMVSVLLMTARK